MSLKYLGLGLSKTATCSLNRALQILGIDSIHWCPGRLQDVIDGSNNSPSFQRYDDVEAVTDIPAAYFWRELWAVYPDLKFILTERNIDAWWVSISTHYNASSPKINRTLQKIVYGSEKTTEFLYKKKYLDHGAACRASIPADRLLIMDIPAGDGWDKLCQFLGLPTPNDPFPFLNRTKDKKHDPLPES